MTDPSNVSPPSPPAHPRTPKPKGVSPTMKAIIGFIVTPLILTDLSDIAYASKSIWLAVLYCAVSLAIPAGIFFRPTRHFSIGAVLFIDGAMLALLVIWGINHFHL